MIKAKMLIFVYVNTHIININTSLHVDSGLTTIKENGGLNSTRKGKGGPKSLERGLI